MTWDDAPQLGPLLDTNEADEFSPGGMWESNPYGLPPTDEIIDEQEDEDGRDQEA
jgi:hypothetical protein